MGQNAPSSMNLPTIPNTKPCPFCGERILELAIKCRHCGEFLDGRERGNLSKASIRRIVLTVLVAVATLGAVSALYIATGIGAEVGAYCSVNGLGIGSCTFTNDGWSPGTNCAQVSLANPSTGRSTQPYTACSGLVWPGSSSERSFPMPFPDDLCEGDIMKGEIWTDVCEIRVQ